MNRTLALAALLSIVMVAGGGLLVFTSEEAAYEYKVKTEQVQSDAATINESEVVQLGELNNVQRQAIFQAWKNSDSFLEGASAYIETNEPLNLSQEERFQLVEIDGVRVLVGFHGPETYTQVTAMSIAGAFLVGSGIPILAFAILVGRQKYGNTN